MEPALKKRTMVEVCVASAADARVAAQGGADRVELNSALELGGLTPSLGTLLQTREAVAIPIIAMVRPRPGGFCYDRSEFEVMRRDAELMVRHGADGLALGILTAEGAIDVGRCQELIHHLTSLGRPLPEGIVFHRAFDFVDDPPTALEQLIGLGIRRVMTSGGAPTALQGATRIAELIDKAAGRIEILPAGGIRGDNVRDLVARTGCEQVHASVRERQVDPPIAHQPPPSLGDAGNDHFATSPRALSDLCRAIQEFGARSR